MKYFIEMIIQTSFKANMLLTGEAFERFLLRSETRQNVYFIHYYLTL